jgi:hypothetical protein
MAWELCIAMAATDVAGLFLTSTIDTPKDAFVNDAA